MKFKKSILSILSISILLVSCSTYKNERSTYFPGTEKLKRSDYYTLADASVEESVTTRFGFMHSSQTGKEYKKGYVGNIKREGGSILIGMMKINLSSFATAAAISVGASYSMTYLSGKVKNINSSRYQQWRIPIIYTIIPGALVGLTLNNMISAAPTRKAKDMTNYNFLEKYKADYLLNPRYEVVEKSTLFSKTSTVKLTSKSIKIKTEKKFK